MTEVYNTISIYRPKQANVLGSPDQVYMMDNLTEYIVKGLKVGSISAIGTPNVNTSSSVYHLPSFLGSLRIFRVMPLILLEIWVMFKECEAWYSLPLHCDWEERWFICRPGSFKEYGQEVSQRYYLGKKTTLQQLWCWLGSNITIVRTWSMTICVTTSALPSFSSSELGMKPGAGLSGKFQANLTLSGQFSLSMRLRTITNARSTSTITVAVTWSWWKMACWALSPMPWQSISPRVQQMLRLSLWQLPALALPTGTGACLGQADGGPMKLRHSEVTQRW